METLRYVLLANGLLVVASVAFYLLLRRETFFQINRLMLWLGILSVLILPTLQFPDWRPQRVRHAMQHTAQVIAPSVLPKAPLPPPVTITLPNGRSYPIAPLRRLARFGWSWQLALIGLYLAGLIFLTGRFVVRLFAVWRLISRSKREKSDDFVLVTNSAINAPFSFLNWVVLNPTGHAYDELDQILRHERVHVRQRHSLDILMAEVICIVFWLNPAAYLFRRLLHQTLEFCADQAVLDEGIDVRMYQYNLLRVSFASGPLPMTSSFSTSQLRTRIRMMNRQRSGWLQLLRYPAVMIVSLTTVMTFARHKAERLATEMATPIAESINTFHEESYSVPDVISQPDSAMTLIDSNVNESDTANHPAGSIMLDSIPAVEPNPSYSERRSNSRLVAYRGDFLYWIITPKTTLEDFGQLQKELAKYSNTLQLQSIKYDPSYTYIDEINVSVAQTGGGSASSWDTTADGYKPIKTIAGYLSTGTQQGSRGIGSLINFPEELRRTSADDEVAIRETINARGREYLVVVGESTFRSVGDGSARFDRAYFENKSTKASGIVVKQNGSLAIDDECATAAVYVNNKLVDNNTVAQWTVDKLYAVVKKTKYDSISKRLNTVALLIYTTEN